MIIALISEYLDIKWQSGIQRGIIETNKQTKSIDGGSNQLHIPCQWSRAVAITSVFFTRWKILPNPVVCSKKSDFNRGKYWKG